MTSFKAAMTSPTKVRTTNGAVAFDHSGVANVDFFATAGAARTAGKGRIETLFHAAWTEDKKMALLNAFYLRDVRGGAGERESFITILQYLERTQSIEFMTDVIALMAEYGRWSDMLHFKSVPVQQAAWEQFRRGIFVDQNGLAAKWAPRRGPKMRAFRDFLGLKNSVYRKVLTTLSDTVEQKMCANEWNKIDYSKVPSMAIRRHQKAFERHDPTRWAEFTRAAERGEVKINAAAIMPHQVLAAPGTEAAKIAQWNALPNFVPEDSRVLPMIDMSGSMSWFQVDKQSSGMDVAIALGMYVAEKNTGAFQNLALSFADTPRLFDLSTMGSNVVARKRGISRMDVGYSTNIQKAFDVVLARAVKHNVPADEMPTTILILSDMQFNQATSDRADKSTFANIKRQYKAAGYNAPKLVFWNLDGRHKQVPVKADASGAALISGYSAALCKSVLDSTAESFTPQNVMVETLSGDRYAPVAAIADKHFQ